MFKKLVLIFSILLLTSVSLAADRYMFICNNQVGNEAADSYFDTETIKYTYSDDVGALCVDVWVKMQYIKKDIDSYVEYLKKQDVNEKVKNSLIADYIKEDYELNHWFMLNNKMSFRGKAQYDKQGAVIDTYETKTNWQTVIPDSVGETMYNTIMDYAKKNDELLKSRM